MKTIVVTGGAGFIGSNLIERLLKEGNKIICIDNLYTGQMRNIHPFEKNQNFKFIKHNIIDPIDIPEKIDMIYNLACPASPPHYQREPLFTINTCFIGLTNMLELCKKNNCKLLQASTSEIYGDPLEHPQSETYWGNVHTTGVRSCYDEGKRIAESLCFIYKKNYQLDIKIVRIFNTYGPNMDVYDGRVVTNFVNQALYNQDITIFGTGNQTRSFQYVDDLIEGMIRVMNTDSSFFGPVNLGNPNEFTIKEMANLILSLIPGSTSQIIYKDLPQDDPVKRKPDISFAFKNLNGWQPKIQINEGLVKTIEYFKEIKKEKEEKEKEKEKEK